MREPLPAPFAYWEYLLEKATSPNHSKKIIMHEGDTIMTVDETRMKVAKCRMEKDPERKLLMEIGIMSEFIEYISGFEKKNKLVDIASEIMKIRRD